MARWHKCYTGKKNETCSKDIETNTETLIMMSQIHRSLVHTKPDTDKQAKTKFDKELSSSSLRDITLCFTESVSPASHVSVNLKFNL